jgi:putative endonuclease
MLVYYEVHDNFESAVTREKRLKKWNQAWKIELIEDFNQEWKDLYDSLV